MTIGILSMQKINNMGSLLQSYGLKKFVESLGNKVHFIDIEKIDEDYKLLGDYKQQFLSEHEKKGVLGKLSKVDKYTFNRLRIKNMSFKQDIIFKNFRINSLEINDNDKSKKNCDICIIGSDEVFNCLNAGYWGFSSQLFGNIPQAKKIITYAASCGSTSYKKLPVEVAQKIEKAFDNIFTFSARDENTREFISSLSSKHVDIHLDPVLIYDFKKEIDNCYLPTVPKNYCLVYSYYNRIHTNEEISCIKKFCKKHNMEIITVGAPQMWNKHYIVSTPFQCLKLFKNADFVITDTFHGTVFATKYTNRFAILARNSNKNKIYDLVKRLNIQKNLMNNINELERIYLYKKDISTFEKKITVERNRTLEYLNTNLQL